MNKTRKAFAILIFAIAMSFAVTYLSLSSQPQSISSLKPTPALTTPALIVTQKTGDITVSGLITIHGLTIPPTEVAFTSGETQEVYKAPINQTNLSYIISLPVNQTYEIDGDWNGRTFNATRIPMGAIQMQLYGGGYVLNLLNVTSTSITQNLQVGMQP